MNAKRKGYRGELSPRPAVDERLLALDAFEAVDGLLISARVGVPYSVAREVARLTDEERSQLLAAGQKAAGAHVQFMNEHRDALAFGAGLAALQAKKFESLALAVAGDQALSLKEVLAIGASIFVPLLLILGLIVISRWRQK
jgi:hypothetical protein